jgi:hypothetical protein
MPSLKDLDKVDWGKLKHAYGSAADVPKFLMALKSKDEDERMDAINQLQSTIWHQGSIYEASSYAVPFLIELLEDKSVREKENILELLELIRTATACSSHSGEGDAAVWVKKAQAAVDSGRAVYLKLVNRDELNENCANLLQAIEPDTGDRDTLIAACKKEPDDAKKASRIEKLSRQYPGDRICLDYYESLIDFPPHYSRLLSSLVAFKVLASQGQKTKYQRAVSNLADCLCKWSMEAEQPPGASSFTKIMKDIPGIAKDIATKLIDDLLNFSDPTANEIKSQLRPLVFFPVSSSSPAQDEIGEMVIGRLLPIFSGSQPFATRPMARVLLHFAFAQKWSAGSEFSDQQRSVLQAICANDQIWMEPKWEIFIAGKRVPVLEYYYGLPADREELRRACHSVVDD